LREAAVQGGEAALQEAARGARRRVEERARHELERTPVEPAQRATGRPMREGSRVRIAASGLEGTVVELRENRAIVEVGGLRMQLPVAGLTVVETQQQPAGKRVPLRSGWTAPDLEASSEIDLRGMRADEVTARVQLALDAAIQADLPSLRIIHGKGTGALREVVTELLQADGRILSFRPGGVGEGGAGVTVAELR
jgi:DNA mismatch repair protein MutS2